MKTKLLFLSTILVYSTTFNIGCNNSETSNEIFKTSNSKVSKNTPDGFRLRNTKVFENLSPTTETVGFLLGVRHGSHYRTLYITYENGQARINFDLPHVVSVQEDKVWFLGTQTFGYGRNCPGLDCQFSFTEVWVSETPLVSKSSERRRKSAHEALLAQFQHPYYADYSWSEKIDYVANNTVCADTDVLGYHDDNQLFRKDDNYCVGLQANMEMDRPLSLDSALSEERIEIIEAQLQTKLERGEFEETLARKATPLDLSQLAESTSADPSFQLVHRDGLTWLVGQASIPAPKDLSVTEKLTVKSDAQMAGSRSVRANNFSLVMNQLKAIDSSILDAFESPEQNIMFFLTQDRLIGIDPTTWDEKLNQPVRWQAVIMADWSIGPEASTWNQRIATALH